MQLGYKLSTEGHDPLAIVDQAVQAEEAGFDFLEASDHYHPWLDVQAHSGNTWVLYGHIAAKTEKVGLVTGVTCPSFRYHPAVVAQMSATLQIVSDGRHTLGVGAGERLNEHVIGGVFPQVHSRHEYFREALEIIRLLWRGGYQSYEGKHLQLDDARVFDLPDTLPQIAVAISGQDSLQIALDLGDGLFATEPKKQLVDKFVAAGKTGPRFAEAPLAWATSEQAAVDEVMDKSRWALLGWKVMSELPNPVNFEAASQPITEDEVKKQFACGPDVSRHVEVVKQYVDAGFDHLVLQNAGPDPDGFFDFFRSELKPALEKL